MAAAPRNTEHNNTAAHPLACEIKWNIFRALGNFELQIFCSIDFEQHDLMDGVYQLGVVLSLFSRVGNWNLNWSVSEWKNENSNARV